MNEHTTENGVGILQYTRRRTLERIGEARNMLENKAISEKRTVNENSVAGPPNPIEIGEKYE